LIGPIQRFSNRLGVDGVVLDQKYIFLRHNVLLRIKALGHSIQAALLRSGRCDIELSESIVHRNATSITQGRRTLDRNVSTSLRATDFQARMGRLSIARPQR
jgi:hypothetical protein